MSRRTGNLPIRVRLFLITFSVILFFLGIIFVTNALLLTPYYNYMKEKNLTSTLQTISGMNFSDADENGRASYAMSTMLKSMEETDNIHIIILDDRLNFFYNSTESLSGISAIDRYEGAKQLFNSLFVMSGEKSRGQGTLDSPAIGRRRNSKTDTNYLSLFSVLPVNVDGEVTYYYVMLNTSVSAIEDAVTAFNDYALVLGIFAMIFCGMLSMVLCSNFVRPILRINEAAKRIADMDFGEKLEIRSRDELGQLAESINHLSSELETKISQLSVANTQLKRDIEQKEKIDLMRRELLSNVSHEFKTPLAIIMGYAEGLQLNINNDEKDYYCSVINDEAVKLNSLACRGTSENHLVYVHGAQDHRPLRNGGRLHAPRRLWTHRGGHQQPARQRPAPHPRRRSHRGQRQSRRGQRDLRRVQFRQPHSRGQPRPYLGEFLQGGQGAHPQIRRLRTGTEDRQLDRPSSRRQLFGGKHPRRRAFPLLSPQELSERARRADRLIAFQ